MKIEVGKKYQDRNVPEWTLDVVKQDLNGFHVVYPSGATNILCAVVIEAFYEPFEETPC